MPSAASDHITETPARGPLPLRHRILYGMGYISVALTADMTLAWILKRYRPDPADPRWEVLTTAAAFGLAMILGRLVDAIADPLIGYWSDRTSSRWGRRKPFILIGAPLLALTFVLIWLPPDAMATPLNAIYLAAMAALMFLCFTVVVCPYLAMLPEITDDPSERVNLTAWQGGFNIVGAIAGMLLAGWLIDHYGYLTMALIFAPVVLLCSWAPLLVPTPCEGEEPSKMAFGQALGATLRDPWFVPYVISQLLFWVSLRIILGALPKIVEVRAQVDETEQGIVMASGLGVAALLFPFIPALARRFGKRRLLGAGMLWYGVMMLPVVYMGRLPIPMSPLGQAILIMGLVGPAIAVVFTLPNAIVADIAARGETVTGERREAMYFGVQGLLVKAGLGLGIGLAAWELAFFGETAADQGGFTACAITAMILALLAALVLTRYPGD